MHSNGSVCCSSGLVPGSLLAKESPIGRTHVAGSPGSGVCRVVVGKGGVVGVSCGVSDGVSSFGYSVPGVGVGSVASRKRMPPSWLARSGGDAQQGGLEEGAVLVRDDLDRMLQVSIFCDRLTL